MEITTVIVDDEPAARRRLRLLVKGDPAVKVVGECGDGISAVEMIRNLRPALLFLDVQIPGADGFGVLERVGDSPQLPAVVFVTAHREYAIPAFEAQALDYLLKPFKRARFREVLARAKAHIVLRMQEENLEPSPTDAGVQDFPQLLLLKSGGRLLFRKMSELKWVQAERDYLNVHLDSSTYFIRDTMKNFQQRLDKASFIRIHRSTIVNVNQISELRPMLGGDYSVVLHDKTELTLSRRYRSALDNLLRRKLVSLPKST